MNAQTIEYIENLLAQGKKIDQIIIEERDSYNLREERRIAIASVYEMQNHAQTKINNWEYDHMLWDTVAIINEAKLEIKANKKKLQDEKPKNKK